jgi:outer membrane protein
MLKMIIPCVLLAVASGCEFSQPTDPRPPAVASRAEEGPPSALSAGESDAPEETPLTLEKCVQIALQNNPDVAARKWDVQAAIAERDAATGQRWPSLHAVGSFVHYLDNQRLVPPQNPGYPMVYTEDIGAGDLVVNMPIFTGGKITNQIKASELLRAAAENRLARTREELVFNLSSAFYAILGQEKVIESLEFSRTALQEHRQRVEDLLAAQKATLVDLLRTEVRLADLEQNLLRERNTLAIESRVLVNLLGVREMSSPPSIAGGLALETVEASLDESLARAYAVRPDYSAARANVGAQSRRVDIARAGGLPTVALRGSYGGRWAVDSSIMQEGAKESEDVGQVGVVVDVPIFEGGQIRARVRQELAKLGAAREALRKLELQIRLEVETAILNVTSNRERVRATEKAIEQAKESLRIERQKYDLGKGSITDVLDAQSALLDTQTGYYKALAAYNASVAELRLARGEAP